MSSRKIVYPDVADIFARKERGRERLASLPLGEKIRMLEAMRARDGAIRRAREVRIKRTAQVPEKG